MRSENRFDLRSEPGPGLLCQNRPYIFIGIRGLLSRDVLLLGFCAFKLRGDIRHVSTQLLQPVDENFLVLICHIYFRRDEIFHIPGLGFNGLVGFSPIAMMKNSLGTTLAVEKYGSAFFKNGAQPSGVLEHPGVLKNPEKIRENWSDVYGGPNNAHKVAVLEEGMSYKAISLPPEDSQFLSTRQFGVNEICRIFRVPPHMVQDLEHATFSNIEHQSIDFVMHTLMPWLVRFEQAIMKDLLLEAEQDQYFPKFNVDGLLRGDYASRMQGYATGISNGFLSPNDIRRLENMNLIPAEKGGDDYGARCYHRPAGCIHRAVHRKLVSDVGRRKRDLLRHLGRYHRLVRYGAEPAEISRGDCVRLVRQYMGIRLVRHQILLRDDLERDRGLLLRHLERHCFHCHRAGQCGEDCGHYGFQCQMNISIRILKK